MMFVLAVEARQVRFEVLPFEPADPECFGVGVDPRGGALQGCGQGVRLRRRIRLPSPAPS